MKKRIISLVLCLTIMLSFIAPAAYASDDVSNDIVVIDDNSIVITDTTPQTVEETTAAVTEAPTDAPIVTNEPAALVCDCGNATIAMISHADSCTLKKHYMSVCGETAADIHAQWSSFPADVQEYILAYLGWNDQAKLNELNALLAADAAAPKGTDSTTAADGTVVSVEGIPEGASVVVAESPFAEIATFGADQEGADKNLFIWDISIQDANGTAWQPEGKVHVELEIPNVKLHKNTEVYVLHINDDGEESRIEAEVTENGGIAFDTDGFSTFAGFSVDFAYEGVEFSLRGLESILLSELMDNLKMPLDIQDVAKVEFTNEELVKIEALNGDWNLISLESFTSEEKLTITTKDGKVYVIDVTDPTYAGFYAITNEGGWYNGNGFSGDLSGGDGVITILLDDSGQPAINGDSYNSKLTDEKRFVVDGGGILYLELQHADLYETGKTTSSVNDLVWDLMQIRVTGGSTLVIRVGGSFEGDETITLRYKKNDNGGFGAVFPMFDVDNGNLLIRCSDVSKLPADLGVASNKGSFFSTQNDDWTDNGKSFIPMIFDGQNFATNIQPEAMKDHPLILLRSTSGTARHFFIEDVEFKNAKFRAIRCYANEMANLQVKDCVFGNTVQVHYTGSENGGAAINIEANQLFQGQSATRTDITKFVVDHCKFDGVNANDDGGAIENNGRIAETEIKNSKFLNISTTQKSAAGEDIYAAQGGAIAFKGYMGKILIDSCEFNNVKVKEFGGAIYFESVKNENNNYSKFNEVTFQNCDFIDCVSKIKHGGAIYVKAQVHTMKFLGCKFERCRSLGNGAAISFSAKSMTDFNAWQESFTGYGANNTATYTWTTNGDPCTTYNTILIDAYNGRQSQFIDCRASTSAGAIEFAQNVYVETADIKNTLIDGCKAVNNGSAIFMSSPIVKSLDLYKVTVTNCDYIKGIPSGTSYQKDENGHYVDAPSDPNAVYIPANDASGTIRSTGATTCILTMDQCTVTNNYSYSNGGGLYWNACYTRGILDRCYATVSNSTFSGNYAANYGGGIYCESNLTVTNCTINGNYAELYGGGIAQQVYSNAGRMLMAGEQTNMTVNGNTQIFDNYSNRYGGGISIRANPTQSIQAANANVGHAVILNLDGAVIRNNTAKSHGGGVYFREERDMKGYSDTDENGNSIIVSDEEDIRRNNAELDTYTKSISLFNAEIYDNRAGIAQDWTSADHTQSTSAGHGGGIYMSSSGQTTLNVSSGTIYRNTAQQGNGGGIYMEGNGATLTITGGTVGGSEANKNHAILANGEGGNGGGIAIAGGAKIVMKVADGADTGGTVSYNKADVDGGGIWLDEKPKDKNSNEITIAKGNILYNTAGGSGGGVSMKYRSIAEMTGGQVAHNTAVNNGGGMEIYYYANLTMTGGVIEENVATNGYGGGISAHYYGTTTITGNTIIRNNHADKSAGGGIFAQKYNISVSGGEIYGNTAKNGGGVFSIASSTDNYLTTISGGKIYSNTATNNGGGVYNNGSKVILSGGSIYENTAYSGGGIYADASSTTTVSSGSIYKNDTTQGWGGGIYVIGQNSKITVTGGSIYENTSTGGCGGGINAENYAELIIQGGSIYKNTAGTYGGGIHSYNNGTILMTGGSIYENTASAAGGGISLRNNSTATIKDDGSGSYGKITQNTAARGGGVAVESGAELTVINGYITYNKAVGSPTVTSAIGHNTSLKGTGGGIYVADGNSSTDPSKFTLSGQNIAIYGNLADFAADDVFANSDNTVLVVPVVSQMDLSGYKYKAEGWFEDYPINDPSYETGTNLGADQGIKNGNVYRYRGARTSQRVLIVEPKTTGTTFAPNVANEYVCMTLGMPSAVEDVVVVDFGLPVDIHVLVNEMMTSGKATITGIGPKRGTPTDLIDWADQMPSDYGTTYSLPYNMGTVKIENNGATDPKAGAIRFTFIRSTAMKMDTQQTFGYAVRYSNSQDANGKDQYYYYFANVTIVPATSIYYEDSFLTFKDSSVTSGNDPTFGEWTVDGTAGDKVQAEDRPGEAGLSNIDANNIYGYDPAYNSYTMHSLGSAMKVTVDQATGSATTAPKATFSFKGTGFDVISMTNSKTGCVQVIVKDSSGKEVKNFIVDNYYGFNYELCDVKYVYNTNDQGVGSWSRYLDGSSEATAATAAFTYPTPTTASYGTKYAAVELYDGVLHNMTYEYVKRTANGKTYGVWIRHIGAEAPAGATATNRNIVYEGKVVTAVEYDWVATPAEDQDGGQYQVPCIKVTDLAYGTYSVEIKACYLSYFNQTGNMEIVDGKDKGSYTIWVDAVRIYNPANNSYTDIVYEMDKESKPTYATIKSMLVGQGNFKGGTTAAGAVFIDGKSSNNSIGDYADEGPNNETYLSNNQAIGFKLICKTSQAQGAPVAIHVGAKLVSGSTADLKATYRTSSTVGYSTITTHKITSATAMFYELPNLEWTWNTAGYWESSAIVINCANAGTGVLSLTDMKFIASGSAVAMVNDWDGDLDTIDQYENSLFVLIDDDVIAATENIVGDPQPDVEPTTECRLSALEVSCDGEVILRMKMNIAEAIVNDDNAYVVISKNGEDTTITAAQLRAMGTDANGRYVLEQGIASGEMTYDVTVQIYDGNGNLVNIVDYVTGESATSVSRSVVDYAERIFALGTQEQKDLVTALVTYGGYSQLFFNTDAENPAFNVLTQAGVAIPAMDDISLDTFNQEIIRSGDAIGITQTNTTVYLDSAIYMRVYFVLDEGKSIEDFSFQLTHSINNVEQVKALQPVFDAGNNRYYVDIQNIPAAYLDYQYLITVTDNAGGAYTVSTSVMAWAKLALAKYTDPDQINMIKALYYYNQAANTYFGK